MPDPNMQGDKIRNAWNDFVTLTERAYGHLLEGEIKSMLEAVFVSGYCAGHNDVMETIMGQQMVVDSFNEILNNKNNNN